MKKLSGEALEVMQERLRRRTSAFYRSVCYQPEISFMVVKRFALLFRAMVTLHPELALELFEEAQEDQLRRLGLCAQCYEHKLPAHLVDAERVICESCKKLNEEQYLGLAHADEDLSVEARLAYIDEELAEQREKLQGYLEERQELRGGAGAAEDTVRE